MGMNKKTLAAFAGGAAALVAAFVLLSGDGSAHASSAREPMLPRTPAPVAAARPRAAYAGPSASVKEGNVAAPALRAADGPALDKARDLLRRLQAAVGPGTELPEDLRGDLLAFLSASEENRSALFHLIWDPAVPRAVAGNLRLFLMGLPDSETRRTLLAAYDAVDPNAVAAADGAARAKDPALLVATLRAASAAERVELMKKLPVDCGTEPRIGAWLLEAARDADEAVRCAAYARLAAAGNRDALTLLASVAGDSGRSEIERKHASFALTLHPEKIDVGELLRLYDGATEDVRRNLLRALSEAPSNRRVDDLLVEVLTSSDISEKTRRSAASAVAARLFRLSDEESRALGTRTAEAIKSLPAEDAVTVLTHLGNSVVKNQPLREMIQDLRRTAPEGGAIQVAMTNVPSLRFVLGMN
jgi:hypothetical protein